MRDKLKILAKQNRDLFDVETPNENLWDVIAQKSFPEKRHSPLKYWQAAAVLLLATSALFGYLLIQKNDAPPTLSHLSVEYAQIEQDYQAAIVQVKARLQLYEFNEAEFAWIYKELDNLDKINLKYRTDLKQGTYNERIIEVLIDHYEKKLRLLKKLELEINRKSNEQKINNI